MTFCYLKRRQNFLSTREYFLRGGYLSEVCILSIHVSRLIPLFSLMSDMLYFTSWHFLKAPFKSLSTSLTSLRLLVWTKNIAFCLHAYISFKETKEKYSLLNNLLDIPLIYGILLKSCRSLSSQFTICLLEPVTTFEFST